MLRSMSAEHHGGHGAVFTVCTTLSVALLAAGTAVTQFVGSRRD
jgi:hypothetical protein